MENPISDENLPVKNLNVSFKFTFFFFRNQFYTNFKKIV